MPEESRPDPAISPLHQLAAAVFLIAGLFWLRASVREQSKASAAADRGLLRTPRALGLRLEANLLNATLAAARSGAFSRGTARGEDTTLRDIWSRTGSECIGGDPNFVRLDDGTFVRQFAWPAAGHDDGSWIRYVWREETPGGSDDSDSQAPGLILVETSDRVRRYALTSRYHGHDHGPAADAAFAPEPVGGLADGTEGRDGETWHRWVRPDEVADRWLRDAGPWAR